MSKIITILFLSLLLLSACQPKKKVEQAKHPHCVPEGSLPLKYASRFAVDFYNGFKVISVFNNSDTIQYVLTPKGKPAPVDFAYAVHLELPLSKVVCASTNHVAAIAQLNALDKLIGLTNADLIYNKEVQTRLANGQISPLGSLEMNDEKLAMLKPDFVMTSGPFDGGDKLRIKLQTLKISQVINLDYLEQNPLARAEWLKFTAAFFDAELEADSMFKAVETEYLGLKEKAAKATTKPTVFCNMPFKEIWYMPSGENYMPMIIADAGGDFLWKDSKATNGLNLSLDYEAVYAKAANADVWLVNALVQNADDVKNADSKNALFIAFKTKQLYNQDNRRTQNGGLDFWESGALNPHLVLADLIAIFHPELMPNHVFVYYRKLP
jgi:iron complex transport system substrate-binding protein